MDDVAKTSVVLDREPDQEKSIDPSGPRIRCPLCGWSPRKDYVWSCTCGHDWNTFDTGGVCPACLHRWTSTQWLKCGGWFSGLRLVCSAMTKQDERDGQVSM